MAMAPIGITHDAPEKIVWVCCYSGRIMAFDDR